MKIQAKQQVQLALLAALTASVACNVFAAEPSLVGRLVAGWPPVALLLTVDVVGKVPASSGWLGVARFVATGVVALVAAVASFSHMHHVALAYGESELVAWLFPFTVDGLAVACSIGLVELSRRKTTTPAVEPDIPAAASTASVVEPETAVVAPAPLSVVADEELSPAVDAGLVVRSSQTDAPKSSGLIPVLNK